ncbi:MAG: hypothetical protein ACREJU_01910 [Nitrospiraceae bacterium]
MAAILTPTPDPFNQCLMALPMYVFYEVGIISAGIFGKKTPAPGQTAPVPAGNGKPDLPVAKPAVAAGDSYVAVPDPARRR